jgi:hypothetical protein
MTRPIWVLTGWVLFSACTGSEPWQPPTQADIDPMYTDCSGGEACVIVQLGCCDHCNGGAAVSVTAGSETAVMDAYGQSCRPPVACTEMACAPRIAECEAGVCVSVEASF